MIATLISMFWITLIIVGVVAGSALIVVAVGLLVDLAEELRDEW